MTVNNLPDYIIDSEFLSEEELISFTEKLKKLPYSLHQVIGASSDGITGISGDKFLDRLIAVSEYRRGFGGVELLLPIAEELVDKFCKKHNLKLLEFFRTRVNVTFMSKDSRPLTPHVDMLNKKNHYILLLFFNDCDGDTIAYDLKADGDMHTQEELFVLERFSPKAGKAVLFDGDFFHAWTAPVLSEYRLSMIANIAIEPVETVGLEPTTTEL
jgi:hypothetical protein